MAGTGASRIHAPFILAPEKGGDPIPGHLPAPLMSCVPFSGMLPILQQAAEAVALGRALEAAPVPGGAAAGAAAAAPPLESHPQLRNPAGEEGSGAGGRMLSVTQ